MSEHLCPMKVDKVNDGYYCIEGRCAWWVGGEHQCCSVRQVAFLLGQLHRELADVVSAIKHLNR